VGYGFSGNLTPGLALFVIVLHFVSNGQELGGKKSVDNGKKENQCCDDIEWFGCGAQDQTLFDAFYGCIIIAFQRAGERLALTRLGVCGDGVAGYRQTGKQDDDQCNPIFPVKHFSLLRIHVLSCYAGLV
jgi:hypothetical protein